MRAAHNETMRQHAIVQVLLVVTEVMRELIQGRDLPSQTALDVSPFRCSD
jgi:hypothetical protein